MGIDNFATKNYKQHMFLDYKDFNYTEQILYGNTFYFEKSTTLDIKK